MSSMAISINTLPMDILSDIISEFVKHGEYQAAMKQIGRLSMVSRLFRDLCSSPYIWKCIYMLSVKGKWTISPTSIHCNSSIYGRSNTCSFKVNCSGFDKSGFYNDQVKDVSIDGSVSFNYEVKNKDEYDQFMKHPKSKNYYLDKQRVHDPIYSIMSRMGILDQSYYFRIPSANSLYWMYPFQSCMCCGNTRKEGVESIGFSSEAEAFVELRELCKSIKTYKDERRHASRHPQLHDMDEYRSGGSKHTEYIRNI